MDAAVMDPPGPPAPQAAAGGPDPLVQAAQDSIDHARIQAAQDSIDHARIQAAQDSIDHVRIQSAQVAMNRAKAPATPGVPSFQRDETADVPSAAAPTAGKSVHGQVASALLAPVTQSMQDAGTVSGLANPGESKGWAAARLGLLAAAPFAGPALDALGLAEVPGAGIAAHTALGAAQGVANAPGSPLVGGAIGAGLGALGATEEPIADGPRSIEVPLSPSKDASAAEGPAQPPGKAPPRAVPAAGEPPPAPGARSTLPPPAPRPGGAGTAGAGVTVQSSSTHAGPGLETDIPPPTDEPELSDEDLPPWARGQNTPADQQELAARQAAAAPTAARTAGGALKGNLAKVPTDEIIREVQRLTDAQGMDRDADVQYTAQDPNDPLAKENAGIEGQGAAFEVQAPMAARGAQRQKAIDRLFAELDNRNVSGDDFARIFGNTEQLRASGISLPTGWAKKLATTVREAVANPRAGATGGDAEVAQAIDAANGRHQLPDFMAQRAARVVAGLTPQQEEQFGQALVARNLEAEALRKPAIARQLTPQAQALRAQLPAGVEQTPWFQQALGRHQQMVEAPLERGALEAGVDPLAMRRPASGGYLRLLPEEPAPGPGGVKMVTPGGATRGLGSQQAGAANPVTGNAAGYQTGYRAIVRADAADKMVKAQNNRLLEAVARTGQEFPYWQSRPPQAPGQPPLPLVRTQVPEGTPVVAFNDQHELIDPRPAPPGTRMFQVSEPVKAMLDTYQNRPTALPPAMQGLAKANSFVTRAAIAPPWVARYHALRAAGNVGAAPSGNALQDAAGAALPFGKSLIALRRAGTLDMADPAVMAREERLAQSGALRVDPERTGPAPGTMGKALNSGHDYLFGAEGKDRRLRLVAAEDFERSAAAKGLTPDAPGYASAERRYVVSKMGEPIALNRGALLQGPVAHELAPFAGYHMAGFRTGLGGMVGDVGLPEPTPMERATTVAKGPIGGIARIAGAGLALSGHLPERAGVPLPFYQTPDGKEHYFRGSTAQADSAFGPGAKEEYVGDPAMTAPERNLMAMWQARPGTALAEGQRQAVNDAGSFLGPGAKAAWTAGTGMRDYEGRTGGLEAAGGTPHLETNRNIPDAMMEAARGATAAGALVPGGAPGTSSGWRSLVPFLSQQTLGAPAGQLRHDTGQYVDQVRAAIVSAPDTATARQIMVQGARELARSGMDTTHAQVEWIKAFYGGRAKAAAGVSAARFGAQYSPPQ